ncbi:MAG: substrate-binding domain-containing protein [Pseudomonadales bacterium]
MTCPGKNISRRTTVLLLLVLLSGALASLRTAAQTLDTPGESKDSRGPLYIAVAANFAGTLRQLLDAYATNIEAAESRLSVASTGTLYHQIVHGAPHHLFFSADEKHVLALLEQRLAQPGSLLNYAEGRLVLLRKPLAELSGEPGTSPHRNPEKAPANIASGQQTMQGCGPDAAPALNKPALAKLLQGSAQIVIANPLTAPYGLASLQVIENLADDARLRVLRARNVMHAQQLFNHSSADSVFLSVAQYRAAGGERNAANHVACFVNASLHQPLRQFAVALHGGNRQASINPSALALLAFTDSPAGRQIIQRAGYAVSPVHANNTDHHADK